MKAFVLGASILALAIPLSVAAQDKAPEPPLWAFPVTQPVGPPSKVVDQKLPGSSVKLSEEALKDRTTAVDWFPKAHPAMPPAVKGGRSDVFACGYCHLPNGNGRAENADLAGMPLAYLTQQLADFRSGARTLMDSHFGPAGNMIITAGQTSEADGVEAFKYFSKLPYVSHVKVVETADVPKTTPNGFLYEFNKGGQREPLGQRIIEGPDDFERFEMRDPRMTFTAYVPVGAIARGKALAKGDGSARPACEGCHGVGLRGGIVGPPIAGRFPTGAFRQFYAFKIGSRNGPGAAFMKPIVANLSERDMIDLAAYVGSLPSSAQKAKPSRPN